MILPLSSAFLHSKNLEPVKVPHFCANNSIKNTCAKTNDGRDVMSFKKQGQNVLNNAKSDTKRGFETLKNGCLFIKGVVVSAVKDIKAIAEKFFKNKISKANEVAEKVI